MRLSELPNTRPMGLRSSIPGKPVATWVFTRVPESTPANQLSNQAVSMLNAGDVPGAIRTLQHALALPHEKGTDRASLLNRLGVAWNRLGDLPRAMACFDHSIASRYNPPAIYNKAVATLKLAIAKSGQWPAFSSDRNSINASRLDRGLVNESLDALTHAVRADTNYFAKLARDDNDWAPLVNHPRFRELAGLPPMPRASATSAAAGDAYAPAVDRSPPGEGAPRNASEGQRWFASNERALGFQVGSSDGKTK